MTVTKALHRCSIAADSTGTIHQLARIQGMREARVARGNEYIWLFIVASFILQTSQPSGGPKRVFKVWLRIKLRMFCSQLLPTRGLLEASRRPSRALLWPLGPSKDSPCLKCYGLEALEGLELTGCWRAGRAFSSPPRKHPNFQQSSCTQLTLSLS